MQRRAQRDARGSCRTDSGSRAPAPCLPPSPRQPLSGGPSILGSLTAAPPSQVGRCLLAHGPASAAIRLLACTRTQGQHLPSAQPVPRSPPLPPFPRLHSPSSSPSLCSQRRRCCSATRPPAAGGAACCPAASQTCAPSAGSRVGVAGSGEGGRARQGKAEDDCFVACGMTACSVAGRSGRCWLGAAALISEFEPPPRPASPAPAAQPSGTCKAPSAS